MPTTSHQTQGESLLRPGHTDVEEAALLLARLPMSPVAVSDEDVRGSSNPYADAMQRGQQHALSQDAFPTLLARVS